MKLPPSLDNRFETFVQALPEDYQQQAYEFKAFARSRKIRSPLQLLQLVMLYCGLDLSLRNCAGEVAQYQGYLSDTAVKKRLAACVPWVKSLLSIAIDLIHLSLRQVEITTDKEGEHLDHYVLESGDVVLIDRDYNQPRTLVPLIARGGEVVLRYNAHSMNLFEQDEAGQRIKMDWEARLQSLNRQPGCVPVCLYHGDQRVSGYVHAIALPPEKAAEARRKAKQRARKKGRTAREKTLYLSEWVLIFTSLAPEQLRTETASALYRVRWQVELVIKRMKSLLKIDELRAHKGTPLAELYLQGKLLYAAVIQKITQRRFAALKRTMDHPRQLTDCRLWHSVADEVKASIKACFPRRERFIADVIKSLCERPRKRSLQALPSDILQLIQPGQRLEVNDVLSMG